MSLYIFLRVLYAILHFWFFKPQDDFGSAPMGASSGFCFLLLINSHEYCKLDGDVLDIDKLLDFLGKGRKKASLILEDGMRFNYNSIGVDGFALRGSI